jgi:hypothetical protein
MDGRQLPNGAAWEKGTVYQPELETDYFSW